MAFTPNISPKTRIAYIVFGAALLGAALLVPLPGPSWPVWLGIIGGIVAVEGAVGF